MTDAAAKVTCTLAAGALQADRPVRSGSRDPSLPGPYGVSFEPMLQEIPICPPTFL
ncbi:hypothetical protein GCM10010218_12380 [Streptomyces mashuensis]|uniref:Uncharacterized protein n=1 Tax=Streptomyces mashuensis TaxID=33904 RepID=A0A919AZE3_9ACTN|nr:hypothetical protein GCM10010218_12380 [Streptomyces mashuensis]